MDVQDRNAVFDYENSFSFLRMLNVRVQDVTIGREGALLGLMAVKCELFKCKAVTNVFFRMTNSPASSDVADVVSGSFNFTVT
jgi:hypothetical protein